MDRHYQDLNRQDQVLRQQDSKLRSEKQELRKIAEAHKSLRSNITTREAKSVQNNLD